MANDADQFIDLVPRTLPHPQETLRYVLGEFRTDRYFPELYPRHAIHLPTEVATSIPKRQAEFLAGRLCAQSILSEYGHRQFTVRTGNDREPLWPQDMVGSITHQGNLAAAICYPARNIAGIGIDLAQMIEDGARDALRKVVAVGATEQALLRDDQHGLGQLVLLTLIFSIKESFFKAAFPQVRRHFGFDALEVVELDLDTATVALRCTQPLCPGLEQGSPHQGQLEFINGGTLLTAVVLNRRIGEPK